MQESIVIQDKRISIGSLFYGTNSAESHGICRYKELLTVREIKIEEQPYIGLCSENYHKGWGDLGDRVDPGHGYWQSADGLFKYFELVPSDRVVSGDFCFKKRSLHGMRCKILYEDRRNDQYFVEFNENIGGGCCDGLGKTGHCIAVPFIFLTEVVEGEKSPKPKAKKKEDGPEWNEKEGAYVTNQDTLFEWRRPDEADKFEGAVVIGEEVPQPRRWMKAHPLKATLSEDPIISDEEIDFFGEEAEDPPNGDWTHYEQIVEHKL